MPLGHGVEDHLTAAEQKQAEMEEQVGRRLGLVWSGEAQKGGFPENAIIAAIETMLAGMLVGQDGSICLEEERGKLLISDQERIDLFIENVKDKAAAMRALNASKQEEKGPDHVRLRPNLG
jgi:hypothetical protein